MSVRTFEDEILDNITKTIRRLKRKGIVTMSLDCLLANTPTPKIQTKSISPQHYKEIFNNIATQHFRKFLSKD